MSATEMQWKRGEFQKFYAQIKIRVGGKDTLDIQKGDEFEFDGTIVRYAGAEFPQPGVRGAVRERWATLTQQGQAIDAFRPERSMAKAQSKNETFQNIQREQPSTPHTNSLDEETVLNVTDRSNIQKEGGHVGPEHNRRTAGRISPSVADSQDGQVVSGIRSPVKTSTNIFDPNARAVAENIGFEQGYGRADGAVGKRKFTTEGVSVESMGHVNSTAVQNDPEEGKIIGKIRQSTPLSEAGISTKDTSGLPGVNHSTIQQEGMADAEPTSKLVVARALYPSFPEDWNFFAKPEDKLQRVKELGENQDFIKALYAAEGKKMRKTLKTAYKFLS